MELRRLKTLAGELSHYLNSEICSYVEPQIEHRFISWFFDGKFGHAVTPDITDRKNDGGIDGILYGPGGEIVVIQSKFERSRKLKTTQRSELDAFEAVKTRLLDKESTDFERWLDSVHEPLQAKYRTLRHRLQRSQNYRFIFVTSRRCTLGRSTTLEVCDIYDIAPLWVLFKEGFTPPVEKIQMQINASMAIDGDDQSQFQTLVGLASTKDLTKLLLDERNERLFAQNVRTDLGSKLNKQIRDTYRDEGDTFWLGNNGIYIVCRKIEWVVPAKRVELKYPSIINGSQTIHTIARVKGITKDRQILVRVLEMDIHRDSELLSNVIRRTNAQNPMSPINLCAHEPRQLHIARFLLRNSVFYERREREWRNEKKSDPVFKGFSQVSVREVAQWLAACTWKVGPGKARSNTKKMFEEDYETLFEGFDSEQKSPRYADLLLTVCSGLYVRALIKQLPNSRKGEARIMSLVLTRAVVDALSRNKASRERLIELVKNRSYLGPKVSRNAVTICVQVIREMIREQRRMQRTKRTVDLSNFFKTDTYIKKAYLKVCRKALLKNLGGNLLVAT